MTDGTSATCCRFATPEERASDPEQFDCGTCEYRRHEEQLTAADRDALEVYDALTLPVVRDTKLQAQVLAGMGIDLRWMPRGQVIALLRRLEAIHEVQMSRDPASGGADVPDLE